MSTFKIEDGIEYADTGDDGIIERLLEMFKIEEQKNMEKSDSLRDKRMAGLPVKRSRNK